MSSNNFDELTKDLACSTSRRQALKAIFAGTVGSALGFIGLGTTRAAVCRSNGDPCKYNSQCCSDDCFTVEEPLLKVCTCKAAGVSCTSNNQCCTNDCHNKVCACKPKGIICSSNNE